ncbi:MAG: hypothetical protein KTR31_23840 [Myxococcales bacterium]|nr:hypothetical protein [Myxococcales bacterium]
MDERLRQPFFDYLGDPGPESFLAVRDVVLADPRYDPYGGGLDVTLSEDPQSLLEARAQLRSDVVNLLLSPGAHMMLSFIAKKLDQQEEREVESHIAVLCMKGLKGTGDGSQDRPYRVLRVSDEHDHLSWEQLELRRQELVQQGGRFLDRVECTDGQVVWFDVTDPRAALERRLG